MSLQPYYRDDWATIYHGDCMNILPELNQVDLIFTDPPYPKEYDYVWDYLSDYAVPLLKNGCSLFTYCGHYQLPRVINALSKNLTWYWLCIQPNSSGINPIMYGWRIKVNFKPVLWFVNGKLSRDHPIVDDRLDRIGKDWSKKLHKWAQPVCPSILVKCMPADGIVLDPFAGTGTILRAAKDLGIRSVGIEIEEKTCEIAANRLRQEILNLS